MKKSIFILFLLQGILSASSINKKLFTAVRGDLANFKQQYASAVNRGKNPQTFSNSFSSSLALFAALQGQLEILQFLVSQGFTVAPDVTNQYGYNALMQAASYGQGACVQYLLTLPEYQTQQALNRVSHYGETALQLAQNYLDTVKSSGQQNLINKGQVALDALTHALQ